MSIAIPRTAQRGLWIAAAIAAMAAARCAAQDNGLGQTPMTPSSPSSGADLNSGNISAPTRPDPSSRPRSWPGGGSAAQQTSPSSPVSGVGMRPCAGTVILARVGSEVILDGELLGAANEIINQKLKELPPDKRREVTQKEIDQQRTFLVQQILRKRVETLLVYVDARRGIPAERWPDVEAQITKYFEDEELDKLRVRVGANTRQELEETLRAAGTSVEREKRTFVTNMLAQQWARQQIKPNEEVTYDQMETYYRGHRAEFAKPARASWEELMVRTASYPNEDEARAAIARMGNQVLAGAPLADVARASSEGTTASEGGRRPWTTKGSLASEEIDRMIFSLPIGQLSPIVRTSYGYHIIRVTAREEATVTPFLESQTEIRQKIVQQRTEKQLRDYMAKLEARTPVWTIFDGPDGQTLMSRRPGVTR